MTEDARRDAAFDRSVAEQTASFVGVNTACTPYIGYVRGAELASRALTGDVAVADLIVEAGLMERADAEIVLQPARLPGEDTSDPGL